MIQIKKEEEIKGKVLRDVKYLNDGSCESNMFLFFDDNTFCIFRSYIYGSDTVETEFEYKDFNTEPALDNYQVLYNLDFIDEEAFRKFQDVKDRKRAESEKKKELRQLAYLKNKYPDN